MKRNQNISIEKVGDTFIQLPPICTHMPMCTIFNGGDETIKIIGAVKGRKTIKPKETLKLKVTKSGNWRAVK